MTVNIGGCKCECANVCVCLYVRVRFFGGLKDASSEPCGIVIDIIFHGTGLFCALLLLKRGKTLYLTS